MGQSYLFSHALIWSLWLSLYSKSSWLIQLLFSLWSYSSVGDLPWTEEMPDLSKAFFSILRVSVTSLALSYHLSAHLLCSCQTSSLLFFLLFWEHTFLLYCFQLYVVYKKNILSGNLNNALWHMWPLFKLEILFTVTHMCFDYLIIWL